MNEKPEHRKSAKVMCSNYATQAITATNTGEVVLRFSFFKCGYKFLPVNLLLT